MLDFNDIVTNVKGDRQVFQATGYSATPTNFYWQTWTKPRGVNFVHIFCLGGGGGGNAGSSGGAGGLGGGGGTASRALFPAWVLPNTLFVQVGAGGSGGTPSAAPLVGGVSLVTLWPSSVLTPANNILLRANGGQISSGANPAVPISASTVAQSNLAALAVTSFSIGSGATDAVSTGGRGATAIGQGGTAGGSGATTVNTAGGNGLAYVVGIGNATRNDNTTIPGGTGGAGTGVGGQNGGNGTSGFVLVPNTFFWIGGLGGGGAGRGSGTATSVGGTGGDGAYGSGGGGGGGGSTVALGGSGGKGGDGLVIISSW